MNMKKTCTILCTLVGGAIVGSAVTMMLTPKSGEQMRGSMHRKIHEQLKKIHDNLESCSCMLSGGDCDCNLGGKSDDTEQVAQAESQMKM